MSNNAYNDQLEAIANELALVVGLAQRNAGVKLGVFIKLYLEHFLTNATPAFHLEIIDLLEKTSRGGVAPKAHLSINTKSPPYFEQGNTNSSQLVRRGLIVAPRGFAKSTLCSVFFPLWCALYGFKKDIILVSATISLAKEMLRKIRNELKGNDDIIRDFGELISEEKDTEEHIILKNGISIRAKGRGFQIRGFRPDLLVCDDLEDEDLMYSKDQRDKLEQWFFRTLLPTLKPDQTLVYIGTKIHQLSLISKLEKKEEFIKLFFKALTDGSSIWEDLWPTEALRRQEREIGTYAFQAEYQNNPISLDEQPVKPEMLDGVKLKGESKVRCLAIDPAISEKESSDERAFVLLERVHGEDGKIVGFREVISEKGRWPITEQIRRIISLYKRYEPQRVIIEEVAFQKVYRDILLKEARAEGLFIPVSSAELGMGDTKRPKSKFTRLMEVVHLFEQRLVEVKNPDLRDELISFPNGDADNLVDAIVYALYWLKNYQRGGGFFTKEKEKLPDTKDSIFLQEVRPGVFVAKHGTPSMSESFKPKNFVSYGRS